MPECQDGAAVNGPPYIVSVFKPGAAAFNVVAASEGRESWSTTESLVSRVAVESLEEAQRLVEADAILAQGYLAYDETPRLSEVGGSVSLPDGTRIEVRATTWAGLADEADYFPVQWSRDRILAAWNAKHRAGGN